MRKYDAVIFDFDGVLVESVDVKTQAFAALYAEYGQEIVEKVIAYHLQHAGVSRFDKFRYFQEVLLGKRLSEEEEKMLCVQFSELVVDAVVVAPWVPGAKEFLERFYKEIPLFIASGTPDDEIKEIVNRRQMSHYFVSIHGTPAKKAEIINTIWNKFGFERKRMLMVGDAVADYEGVILTGICFIGRVQHLDKNTFPESVHVIKDLCMLHHYV